MFEMSKQQPETLAHSLIPVVTLCKVLAQISTATYILVQYRLHRCAAALKLSGVHAVQSWTAIAPACAERTAQ